ncbi:MAG: hypothetical protein IKB02_03980 [Clostridia bacterium]|nr:hypothetical protein [Clostridia bacterium]
MTWEIAVGIFALIAAFIPILNVVVKVNKTLCSLEIVVKQIQECIEEQSAKNGIFYTRLSEHEIRLTKIEDHLEITPKSAWEEAWRLYFKKNFENLSKDKKEKKNGEES